MGIALNVATASTDKEVNSCRDPPVVSSISKSIEIVRDWIRVHVTRDKFSEKRLLKNRKSLVAPKSE